MKNVKKCMKSVFTALCCFSVFLTSGLYSFAQQPVSGSAFGIWVAQAIEDHHPDQRFDIDAVPRLAEHPAQFAETERLPQLVQRPDVPQCARRFELDRRQRRIQHIRPAGDLQQPGDDRVETAAQLIEPAERDQRAVLRLFYAI